MIKYAVARQGSQFLSRGPKLGSEVEFTTFAYPNPAFTYPALNFLPPFTVKLRHLCGAYLSAGGARHETVRLLFHLTLVLVDKFVPICRRPD